MEIDINSFLFKEEGEELEYKEGFNVNDIATTIAAFSTHKGGYIIVGVRNDGVPVGFMGSEEEIKAKLSNICNSTNGGQANINVDFKDHGNKKKLAIIRVHAGHRKPYGWRGACYNRIGSRDQKLTPEEITKISLESQNLSYDTLPGKIYNRDANIGDIDEKKLKGYVQEAIVGKRKRAIDFNDTGSVLKNLDLLTNNNCVRNAALLFFAKDVQVAFPQAHIKFLRYHGDKVDDSKLAFRKIINGSLLQQIKKTIELIRANTENRIVMRGLKRIELNQYPLEAVRESIINAIAHRDYSIFGSNITIRLFDNQLEVINPGGLMRGIKLDDLIKGGCPSTRRNTAVCRLLDNIGLMEQSGQGIKNILRAMKDMGLEKPEIFANDALFKIKLKGQQISGTQTKSIVGYSTDLTAVLTTSQQKGLSYIQKVPSPFITIKKYMQARKIKSRITAKRHLDRLKNLGILESKKVGSEIRYTKKI